MDSTKPEFSIVVPCYNEEAAIRETIDQLQTIAKEASRYELIIVDDGSSDGTGQILKNYVKNEIRIKILTHNQNRGYGAALKTGISHAKFDLIVITDADGTYPNHRIPELVAACENYDMVVGARTGEDVEYSKTRMIPKFFLKTWVSWISRQNVPDINSGLRVFRKSIAEHFLTI